MLSEDQIIERLVALSQRESLQLYVPLMLGLQGSHQTLLSLLVAEFGLARLIVDGAPWDSTPLNPHSSHAIEIHIGTLDGSETVARVRELVGHAASLGTGALRAYGGDTDVVLATTLVCTTCGAGLGELRATHFNQGCPYCKGDGCVRCDQTGMHPQAASVRWEGMRLPELLARSVDEARALFASVILPSTADRLRAEITRRLDALERVGLGYIALDRPAPTLSRGESQRVRLAISLSSRLEDMLHVLDEPTIGQHPADIARFLPAFRDLAGPVIYVEHDRLAAAEADQAVDLGPGAGTGGGEVLFQGTPAGLWAADTATGRYFSLRDRVMALEPRPPADEYLTIRGADAAQLTEHRCAHPPGAAHRRYRGIWFRQKHPGRTCPGPFFDPKEADWLCGSLSARRSNRSWSINLRLAATRVPTRLPIPNSRMPSATSLLRPLDYPNPIFPSTARKGLARNAKALVQPRSRCATCLRSGCPARPVRASVSNRRSWMQSLISMAACCPSQIFLIPRLARSAP